MKLFFFSSTETDILMEDRLEGEEETLLEILQEHEKPKAVPDPVSVADIFALAVGVGECCEEKSQQDKEGDCEFLYV